MTYQEAYDRACREDDGISAILEQRKAAKAIGTAQATTQTARMAASSVRSQPSAAPAAQAEGRRAVLEAKYEELSRGSR